MAGRVATAHPGLRRTTSATRCSKLRGIAALGALCALCACGTPQPPERPASLELPTPPSAEVSTSPKPPDTAPARPRVAGPAGAFDDETGWLRIRALGTGEVYVGETLARDDRELVALLDALAPKKQTRSVVLKVDGDLRYARIIELMDLLRDAGYDEVAFQPQSAPSTPSSTP